MMIEELLFKIGIMYALIVAGIIFRHLVKRIESFLKLFSKLLITFLVPVVIFSSTVQFSIPLLDFRFMFLSSVFYIFSSAFAYLFVKGSRLKGASVGPFILNSINANELYLPLPIIYALYDASGLTYSTLFLLIFNIATSFYFIPLYAYYSAIQKEKSKVLGKVLFFPPFIASLVGFTLLMLGFRFPPPFIQPFSYLSQLTTYLALFFIGVNITLRSARWFSRIVLGVAVIRLLLVPLSTFILLKVLGLKEMWSTILIIHAGMPPAINNIIFANHFDLNTQLTAKIVAETTVLALITLPMLIFLGKTL